MKIELIFIHKKAHKVFQERFSYIINPPPNLVPPPKLNLIPVNNPFELRGIKIIPFPVLHVNTILRYRFGNTAYITNAKSVPQESIELLIGIKILIVNALQGNPNPSHFSFEDTFNFASKTTAEKIYLVHLCHSKPHIEVQKLFDRMAREANLNKEFFVGVDDMTIEGIDPFYE
jgi:phosphoribosyl 1,2-cyclic phosphate phosphodiesterase